VSTATAVTASPESDEEVVGDGGCVRGEEVCGELAEVEAGSGPPASLEQAVTTVADTKIAMKPLALPLNRSHLQDLRRSIGIIRCEPDPG
jgi:hypothetical protein